MSKNKSLTIPTQSHRSSHKVLCAVLMAVLMMSMLTVTCFATGTGTGGGTDMWTKATEIMQDVYGKVVGISTIAAVVTAAIALLLMNFSIHRLSCRSSRSS